ncbi:MAG: peptidoglycan-binding protein [Acidobacteria bacterium]|nr:peptidoglycan-binding protein [Acidobacteriota bacterium]
MKIDRQNNLTNVVDNNNINQVNNAQVNEEVQSLPTNQVNQVSSQNRTLRAPQMGNRAVNTLDSFQARDQIANAMQASQKRENIFATDNVAAPTVPQLTNSRFASEPSLQTILQGGVVAKKSEGVKQVQQTLVDLGFVVKGGADGVYGLGTRSAIQQFQREQNLAVTGQIDLATLLALDKAAPAAGQTATLQNARFAGDTRLQEILMGGKTLNRADNGDIVKKVQQALKDMGYNAPVYGVDGALGGETARLLKSFQRAQNLPVTGVLDRATLREMDRLSPAPGQQLEKFPEYERLFSDGFLTTTFAVGFDEADWHNTELGKLRTELSKDGYRLLDVNKSADAELLKRAGYDTANLPEGVAFYNKQFTYKGKTIESLVQLVNPNTPEAVKKFEQGLVNSDMTIYMGHARYGTGPDFDTKESAAGNYVIGSNSSAHTSGKAKAGYDAHMNDILKASGNQLEQTQFDKDRYQIWAFYACKSNNYADEMRVLPKNKDEKNLDVIGSTELIYWHNMAKSGMATLQSITSGKSINNLEAKLYDIHQIENGFYTDGFGDNA